MRRKRAPGAAGILGSGGIGCLHQVLSDGGLDATAASTVPIYMGSQNQMRVQGVPCPGFSSIATATTATPVTVTASAVPAEGVRATKDQVKVPEFSGSKDFGNPDDAEMWLRNVARAIKVNHWTVDDAFQIVQGKLVGSAATWYQNREAFFDKNPLGPAEGWKTFWSQFEQRHVAHDEQSLWLQSQTQQPDETMETYADVICKMAGRLSVSVEM